MVVKLCGYDIHTVNDDEETKLYCAWHIHALLKEKERLVRKHGPDSVADLRKEDHETMSAYNSLIQHYGENTLSIDDILDTDSVQKLMRDHSQYYQDKANARFDKLTNASKKGTVPPCCDAVPSNFNGIVIGSIFPTR